jgi:hypothetical protein
MPLSSAKIFAAVALLQQQEARNGRWIVDCQGYEGRYCAQLSCEFRSLKWQYQDTGNVQRNGSRSEVDVLLPGFPCVIPGIIDCLHQTALKRRHDLLKIGINLNQGCTISLHRLAVATRFLYGGDQLLMSSFWRLEFWDGCQIFGKSMHFWFKACIKLKFRSHRDQTASPLRRQVSAVWDIMAVVCNNHTEQIYC